MGKVRLLVTFKCILLACWSANAAICTIDNVPAATLLLPYFEVDLSNVNGMNTLFSINNASAAAAIAHVTLWTDQSIPTLDFDIYLTGYDVQTISLRDIFAGNLPRTADRDADASDATSPSPPLGSTQAANTNPFTGPFTPSTPTEFNFGGSSGPCIAPFTNPVLDNFRVTNMIAAHTGNNAPAYGGCLGAHYADNIVRGYITVDSVTQCNLLFPSSVGYFSSGIADNRNILWGDYLYVNSFENFAQGETLVHVESCNISSIGNAGHCPFAPGQYTFYGRYASVAGQDQREPLATTFASRFMKGGIFTGGTDLIVWRDSKTIPAGVNGPYICGSTTNLAWFPLNQTAVVAFDEEENAQGLCFAEDVVSPPLGNAQTCFPLEAQRVNLAGGNVIGSDPVPNAAFGWIYVDLNTNVSGVTYPAAAPNIAQSWVTTVMDADGRFSLGYDAIPLDSASYPYVNLLNFIVSPPGPCPVNWQPNALTPVFYGVREYGAAEGAPTPSRVFFPTHDGAVWSAPILEGSGCSRFPLIIFAHGNCGSDSDSYKTWFHLPAHLAQAGYVVVVPELPAIMAGVHPANEDHPDLVLLGRVMTWMREEWEHRRLLLPEPATGIVGHSWGALLGARLAAEKSVSAYASLSGGWADWFDGIPMPIFSLSIPMLFTWGTGNGDFEASLDQHGFWNPLTSPKHKAIFDKSGHWDYLPEGRTTCDEERGPCDFTEVLARDLVATFFGKYLLSESVPPPGDSIPDSLIPELPERTPLQEFYAGNYLKSISQIKNFPGCRITLGWQTAEGTTGSVKKP